MPTEPWNDFIPRAYSSNIEKELLEGLSALCEEVVNFGSRAIQRCCNTQVSGDTDPYLTLSMLLRHSIELVDSISILVLQSSIDPCKILLRGLFETALNIEWMIADRFEQRGKAYIIYKAHYELALLDRFDPSTNAGKELYKDLRKHSQSDLDFNNMPFAEWRKIKHNLINSSGYKEAEEEYQRILAIGQPPKHWYSMFPSTYAKAPANLKDLARQVGHLDWYSFLYSFWSDLAHAGDVISGRIAGPSSFYQIRLVKNAKQITFFALLLGYKCIRQASKGHHPKLVTEIDEWYKREIRGAIKSLGADTNITIV